MSRDLSLYDSLLSLPYRPMLFRHRNLGKTEQRGYMRHKLHGFVHRVEADGIVQEEEIRLVMGVPLHLPDQPLLLLPVHGK